MSRFEPVLTDTLKIQLSLIDGSTETATLNLWDISATPPFNDRCKTCLDSKSIQVEASGFCFFGAFQKIRLELEALQMTPNVNAALENCYPSNMASDMGAGLKIYSLTLGKPADLNDLIPTFASNSDGKLVSVNKQKEFYSSWIKSMSNATQQKN